MKYLSKLNEELHTFIKSDTTAYIGLPIWFFAYAVMLFSFAFLPMDTIYTALQNGITNFVISDTILSLTCGFIAYMISPLRFFIRYENEKEDSIDKKKIKKFYVFIGQIIVIFVWLLIFLGFCVAKHIADTGTI